MTYVADVALVHGTAAMVLAAHLRRELNKGTFDSLTAGAFDAVVAAVVGIELAGRGAALRERVAASGNPNGNTEPLSSSLRADCDGDGSEVSVDEAAVLLGVGLRRARQLAPAFGRKVGGAWRLDRSLVVAEAARRVS